MFSTGPTQWWLTFVGQTVVAISQIFILGIPAQVRGRIITLFCWHISSLEFKALDDFHYCLVRLLLVFDHVTFF